MDGASTSTQRLAAQVIGPGQVRMVHKPLPWPDAGQVRVRLEGCGICASNLVPWSGPAWQSYPLAPGELGHEAWGWIDAVGIGVDPAREGERVAVFGTHGFASHEVVPEDAALPVPKALEGKPVPAEPLACALSIFRMARIGRGDRVVIIGVGFLGAMLTRMATDAGAAVIALSRRQESLDLAREQGAATTALLGDEAEVHAAVDALTDGQGCDVAVECTGSQEPLDIAARLLRESGRLVIAGYHQEGPRQVDMQLWNWRALEIVNAHVRDRSTVLETMREAMDLWSEGAIDPSSLLTHVYPLERLSDGLDAARDKPPRFVKGLVMMPFSRKRLRLAFLGLGWIGRDRMERLSASGLADVVALADSDQNALAACQATARHATQAQALEDIFSERPDAVVIATPSAGHAEQAIRTLEAGMAVFCQKPLGRTAGETAAVVDAARRADKLLAVDLSYRHTEAARALQREISSGRLGELSFVDLCFHNSYGPDKEWFYDRHRAGGGCLTDLGTHLVDLALWLLDWPEMKCTSAQVRHRGDRVPIEGSAVEDFALATLETPSGLPIRLSCSWKLPAGQDAEISASFYGAGGGVSMRNLGGSFYDFETRRLNGCTSEILASPPDDWSGRAAMAWLDRLAHDSCYDPACERLVDVAAVLDDIYASAGVLRDPFSHV
ncbi:Gfo/Idh/MocA family oxidoreductase [Salipiger sp. PrR007]|uniref:Gfo/Idh/MocA family oxidoreductase n=1 Tax=Salipiger sp. PrR007 TaxID=2706884 RepID=UPI001F467913|nr:Gfo/Idh/MocA family oxidoreductase [Salipiger sp. PrR007]